MLPAHSHISPLPPLLLLLFGLAPAPSDLPLPVSPFFTCAPPPLLHKCAVLSFLPDSLFCPLYTVTYRKRCLCVYVCLSVRVDYGDYRQTERSEVARNGSVRTPLPGEQLGMCAEGASTNTRVHAHCMLAKARTHTLNHARATPPPPPRTHPPLFSSPLSLDAHACFRRCIIGRRDGRKQEGDFLLSLSYGSASLLQFNALYGEHFTPSTSTTS